MYKLLKFQFTVTLRNLSDFSNQRQEASSSRSERKKVLPLAFLFRGISSATIVPPQLLQIRASLREIKVEPVSPN